MVRLGVRNCEAITGEVREPGVCRPTWSHPLAFLVSVSNLPLPSSLPCLIPSCIINACFEHFVSLSNGSVWGVDVPRGSGSFTYILETPLLDGTTDDESDDDH